MREVSFRYTDWSIIRRENATSKENMSYMYVHLQFHHCHKSERFVEGNSHTCETVPADLKLRSLRTLLGQLESAYERLTRIPQVVLIKSIGSPYPGRRCPRGETCTC